MTNKEKQILKKMGLKYKIIGSEVIIQGKISLMDYNKIMSTNPGTKPPKNPPKPPVWAQTLIANQATDHALLMQVVNAQATDHALLMQVVNAQAVQGNQISAIQRDVAEMKNTPTMKNELSTSKQ